MKKFTILAVTAISIIASAVYAKQRGLFDFVAPSVNDTATNTDLGTLSDVGTIVYDTEVDQFLGRDGTGAWQTMSNGVGNNSVTNMRSGGVRVLSAMIDATSGTPATVSGREDGDWINTITDNGVGDYTLNFVSGTFSSAANCVCTGFGNTIHCLINGVGDSTSSAVRIQTENTGAINVDTAFTIICVGAP